MSPLGCTTCQTAHLWLFLCILKRTSRECLWYSPHTSNWETRPCHRIRIIVLLMPFTLSYVHHTRVELKILMSSSHAYTMIPHMNTTTCVYTFFFTGLIGFNFSASACPSGCSGKSYIPRAVLWYVVHSWQACLNTQSVDIQKRTSNT